MSIEEAARELKLAYIREHSQRYLTEAKQRGLNLEEALNELLWEEVAHDVSGAINGESTRLSFIRRSI